MVRRVVHTSGELSITLGTLLLLFVVWQLWWTTLVADQQAAQVTQQLGQSWAGTTGEAASTGDAPPVDKAPAANASFGIVHIPAFGADYARPLVQGTSVADLRMGVGHYAGTVMPGGVGNFSMAGHRTTYGAPFNQIAGLKAGDAIVIETRAGWYTYRVTAHEIVAPTQVSVVAPVPDQAGKPATKRYLTMTSCHPEYSARQRYVVHALFQSYQQRSAGAPSSLKG